MSDARAKTFRHLRHDLISFALVAVVPVALACVFPYEAIGFRATESARGQSFSCAFVSLDVDEERAALAAARTAWQVDSAGVRGMRTDLSSSDLPPVPTRPVISVRAGRAISVAGAAYVPNALPPTVAAPPPDKITAGTPSISEEAPTFSREELLKIQW